MTEPRTSSAHRDRPLAPRTSCVAFSARAKSVSVCGHVVADDLAVGAAQVLEQLSVAHEQRPRVAAASPSPGEHVHADEVAARAHGHAGGPPDELLAAGRAREGHDHPLARLPRLVDAVGDLVVLQGVVDLVGHPHQRQLPQRAEVADPEVVAEGGVDLLRRRRCCRGPCAGAAPRAPCRPARPGRRRGRPRRGSSPAA